MSSSHRERAPIAVSKHALILGDDHVLHRAQRAMLGLGALGVAASLAGLLVDPARFYRSYLVAYLFWSGIALGSLALLCLYHVAGGRWGAVIRRVLEAATRTLPLLVVGFVPIVFGIHDLYEWSHAAEVAKDPLLAHKAPYLNTPFFLVRTAVYFAVWFALALFLNRWSVEQDETGNPRLANKLELLGRGGLVLYVLTMSFAAIDWGMSLEPHWYSTIYGVLIIGGQALSAFAFVIPVLLLIADRPPLSSIVTAEQFHDLGKFLLGFVILYTYFAFSQFLIIWSANLPEEIPWYLRRLHGGWQVVAVSLVLFHFALPFVILLSRDLKRNARRLVVVALLVLFMRWVDLNWLVHPAFSPATLSVSWLDFATVIGAGGVWMGVFLWHLRERPLVPLHDPLLPLEVTA